MPPGKKKPAQTLTILLSPFLLLPLTVHLKDGTAVHLEERKGKKKSANNFTTPKTIFPPTTCGEEKRKKKETYNVNARLITCTRLSNRSGRGLVGTREGFGIASSTGNRCAFHDGGSDGLRVGGAMLCLGVDHDGGRGGEEGEDG